MKLNKKILIPMAALPFVCCIAVFAATILFFNTMSAANRVWFIVLSGSLIASTAFISYTIIKRFIKHTSENMVNKVEAALLTTSAMFDSSPQINLLFDNNFKLIDCNPAALKFIGFDTKESLLAGFMERLTKSIPRTQPDGHISVPLAERFKTTLNEGSVKFETLLIVNDSPKDLSVEFKKIPYADSFAIVAYVFDITESKKSIARLNEANKRAMLMLDTSPICAQIWDRNLNTIDCNEAGVRLYGFNDKAEFIDRFMECCMPEYQPDGQRSVDKAERLVSQAFEEGYCVFAWMHKMPLDDTPIPAEITLVKAKYGDDDVVVGYTRDMREHEKMMQGINQRGNLLQAVNKAAALLLVTDDSGNIESSLTAGMELIGRAIDADRIHIWQTKIIDDESFLVCAYGWLSETGKQKQTAFTGLKLASRDRQDWIDKFMQGEYISGSLINLPLDERVKLESYGAKSFVVIPLFLKDQLWGHFAVDDCTHEREFTTDEIDILWSISIMMASAIDRQLHLTEMEQTQENLRLARDIAEDASRAKSSFLASMSHEIRTPMNSIIGFSELAQDDSTPVKAKEYLNNISESATWLLAIINNILDISKIEAGKMVLENIPFDLHDIFAHCQSLIIPRAKEKGVELYCYAEPFIGKKLVGDPVRMRQILMNLLSNAVKFTNSGTVKLMANVTNSNDDKTTLEFEVKDSGIGMNQEQISKIFEPFLQADDSITRRFGGTGLGLSITKNFIELMGGTLSVESTVGVGSKFSFELTFDTVDDTTELGSTTILLKESEKPNFKGEVLVCEDNSLNIKVICDHLSKVGLDTVVAQNGKEGVDAVKKRMKSGEKQFDLIFMDIHMPVMDGLEAASKINKLGFKAPIIALTANVMANDVALYNENGMSDTMGKPFTSQELWQCLIKHIPVEKYSIIDMQRQSEEEEKLSRQIKLNFVTDNQTTYTDIIKHIEINDITTAHRLVHTLKGNAGSIGEKQLQAAAAAVEHMLIETKGKEFKRERDELNLHTLESELKSVLDKLAPLLAEAEEKSRVKITDDSKVREIIDKLEPMLKNKNPDCEDLLDDVRTIPGAEELVRQMEKFKFRQALEELSAIKKGWNIQ